MRHHATRFVLIGLLVCVLPVQAGPGDPKTLVVRGRTTDQEGFPVERVRVWSEGARKITSISDVDGQYELVFPIGSAVDLKRQPLSLAIRAEAKGWHFAIPGGDPVLALELRLEATPDSTTRCVARSNHERFAAAAARAVGMEGEAVGVTVVPFLGLKGKGETISKASEFRFKAHTALDFTLPEPVGSARGAIADAAGSALPLPSARQPVDLPRGPTPLAETAVRDSTPPASRPTTSVSTPPASDRGGFKQETPSGESRASTAPPKSASIRPAPARTPPSGPTRSGASPAVSLIPAAGALGEVERVGKAPARGSQKSKRASTRRDRRAANDEGARRVASALPPAESQVREEGAGARAGTEERRPSAIVHPEPFTKETRSRSRPLLIRAPAATGSGACECRVEGTLEVRSVRPLPRRERVEVSLQGYPNIKDTVELFMGSPRLFILPAVPCGMHRLEIRVLSGRRFEVISRDAMQYFRCDQNRAIHSKVVLAPR